MYRNRRYLWLGHVFFSLTICFGKVSRSSVVLADAVPTTQAEPFETITDNQFVILALDLRQLLLDFFCNSKYFRAFFKRNCPISVTNW